MTSVVVNIPIQKLSLQAQQKFLVSDARNPGQLKGRSLRVRYPYGSKSAQICFVDGGRTLRCKCSVFGAISGQNALTLPDLPRAVNLAFDQIGQRLHAEFGTGKLEIDGRRDVVFGSVDLVRHYQVGTPDDVSNLLAAIHDELRRAAGQLTTMLVTKGKYNETVEVVLPALKMKVKFYNKYVQLQRPGHRLPQALPAREELLELMRGQVRMEVTVTRQALLERGLANLSAWTPAAREAIFRDVFKMLGLTGEFQTDSPDPVLQRLSRPLQLLYLRWLTGQGFDGYPRATLAAQRKQLRDQVAVDINVVPQRRPRPRMRVMDVFTDERQVKFTDQQIATWVPEWRKKVAA